jgi:hypothetical protein
MPIPQHRDDRVQPIPADRHVQRDLQLGTDVRFALAAREGDESDAVEAFGSQGSRHLRGEAGLAGATWPEETPALSVAITERRRAG